jgi:K+ transporter
MPAAATAGRPTKWVGLSALGVVFGDLGTSPLYTLQTVVQAMGGGLTPTSAIGILSLIFADCSIMDIRIALPYPLVGARNSGVRSLWMGGRNASAVG